MAFHGMQSKKPPEKPSTFARTARQWGESKAKKSTGNRADRLYGKGK